MEPQSRRTPVLVGKSGASVFKVRREDGVEWLEKLGPSDEIGREVAVLNWCRPWLPVPTVLHSEPGVVAMSVLPGVNLTEASPDRAVAMIGEALRLVHAVPVEDCPFRAGWALRLKQAERRVLSGLVDESDFDEVNRGRTAVDILSELRSLPAPPDVTCFTHGEYLAADEAVRADHEVAQSVETNAVKSYDERVRFGRLMGRDTHEHRPAHLQRGLAPCRCHLHVWEIAANIFDWRERLAAAFVAMSWTRSYNGCLRHDRALLSGTPTR